MKERLIKEVIRKVSLWRVLYNGFKDENGKFVQMSLEEAARHVGLPKKSLDDYLLQIRLGKKYGFDFNIHSNSRVGELRRFVREKRKSSTDTDEI